MENVERDELEVSETDIMMVVANVDIRDLECELTVSELL